MAFREVVSCAIHVLSPSTTKLRRTSAVHPSLGGHPLHVGSEVHERGPLSRRSRRSRLCWPHRLTLERSMPSMAAASSTATQGAIAGPSGAVAGPAAVQSPAIGNELRSVGHPNSNSTSPDGGWSIYGNTNSAWTAPTSTTTHGAALMSLAGIGANFVTGAVTSAPSSRCASLLRSASVATPRDITAVTITASWSPRANRANLAPNAGGRKRRRPVRRKPILAASGGFVLGALVAAVVLLASWAFGASGPSAASISMTPGVNLDLSCPNAVSNAAVTANAETVQCAPDTTTSSSTTTTVASTTTSATSATSTTTSTAVPSTTTTTLPTGGNPPLAASVSANGRYLVDQNGQPLLLNGDSAWDLAWKLAPAGQATYLADRAAHGFNAVITDLVGSAGVMGGSANGANYAGVAPFTSGFTPNPVYWGGIDTFLQTAAADGVTVLAFPINWYAAQNGNVFSSMTNAQALAFGQFLAARYPPSSYPGIVWAVGNDYGGDGIGTGCCNQGFQTQYQNLLAGLGAAHPTTAELGFWETLSTDGTTLGPSVSLNLAYTYHPTYAEALRGWAANAEPVFLGEGAYENATTGFPSAALDLRKEQAWTLTSGGAGSFYGNDDLWQFGSGWQNQLDTADVAQRTALEAAVARTRSPWSVPVLMESLDARVGIGHVVGMDEVFEAQSDHLARVVNAEHPRVRGVDLKVPAVQVDKRHPDRRVLKPTAEPLLARAQRRLRPLALRDVLNLREQHRRSAVRIEHRGGPHQRVHNNPIPADVALLGHIRLAFLDHHPDALPVRGHILAVREAREVLSASCAGSSKPSIRANAAFTSMSVPSRPVSAIPAGEWSNPLWNSWSLARSASSTRLRSVTSPMLPPTRTTRPSSITGRPTVRTQTRCPSARISPSSRS